VADDRSTERLRSFVDELLMTAPSLARYAPGVGSRHLSRAELQDDVGDLLLELWPWLVSRERSASEIQAITPVLERLVAQSPVGVQELIGNSLPHEGPAVERLRAISGPRFRDLVDREAVVFDTDEHVERHVNDIVSTILRECAAFAAHSRLLVSDSHGAPEGYGLLLEFEHWLRRHGHATPSEAVRAVDRLCEAGEQNERLRQLLDFTIFEEPLPEWSLPMLGPVAAAFAGHRPA
jgi:hypothetical protein